MFKKVVKSSLVFLVGFTMIVPFAFAQESSLPTSEELVQQLQLLRTEIYQIREAVDDTREIAVDSRLDAEKFKEETLYRLGLWRGKLGEGMLMSISAQDAAERAEKLVKTANEQVALALNRMEALEKKVDALNTNVETLKTDVFLAKEMAATAKAQADQAVKALEKKVDALNTNVETLKTDVFLAKEMAATAKAQADQARKEIRELAGEYRKDRELFLGKIEKSLVDIKEKEEKFKPQKIELKTPPLSKNYRVKKGDSLWRISGRPDIYNDPAHWKKIFEANKNTLISPDSLYPGQELIIPN